MRNIPYTHLPQDQMMKVEHDQTIYHFKRTEDGTWVLYGAMEPEPGTHEGFIIPRTVPDAVRELALQELKRRATFKTAAQHELPELCSLAGTAVTAINALVPRLQELGLSFDDLRLHIKHKTFGGFLRHVLATAPTQD